jgi:hypothetical protein
MRLGIFVALVVGAIVLVLAPAAAGQGRERLEMYTLEGRADHLLR